MVDVDAVAAVAFGRVQAVVGSREQALLGALRIGRGDAYAHGDRNVAGERRPGVFGDHEPDRARIVVSRPGGEVRYPYSVQLVTDHGADAAHRVPPLRGWAASNSAGLAFLVQKGRPADPPDWAGLVGGAVAALSALRPDAGDHGVKAAIDRAIERDAGDLGAPAARQPG